uniref:At1g61320/AtMIF1 LRR domain-containing protein n=1 Tax=Oryza sativa subsp. japonica TaxID=39947 RepID=Q653C2_ORYSJ|nr:hypothetical protein [Oryza sativa Japonica Group]
MPPFSSEPMTNNEGEPVEDASCRSVRRRRYREQTSTNSAPLRQQGDISEGAQNTMTGFDFDRLPQETFSLNVYEGTSYEKEKEPVDIIDSILQNHSGTGVKTLKLDVSNYFKPITADHINNWLNAAVKPGIIEIAAGEYDLAWKDPALQDSNADSLQIRRIPEIHHANLKKTDHNTAAVPTNNKVGGKCVKNLPTTAICCRARSPMGHGP